MRFTELKSPGAALFAALALTACLGEETPFGAETTLAVDGGSNPTTAVDPTTGAAFVSWVGTHDGESNVWLARIESDGLVGEPVRVNDAAGDAAAHFQAPAQVAVGPDGEVYVLWTNNTHIEGRRFPASDLRFARSDDGGRTFGPAMTVNDDVDGPPTSHTFHNMLVGVDGTIHVSWLDSRAGVSAVDGPHEAQDHTAHGHGGGGAFPGEQTQSGPELRVAVSKDRGRSFTSGVIVDRNTCPCCRTQMTAGPDGALYVAWRKVFDGDVRDIVVARSDDDGLTWSEPRKVHDDGWVFPGCPHAGPSVMVGETGALHVVWYTGREGAAGLFYARSDDQGESFGEPTALVSDRVVAPSITSMSAVEGSVWIAWEDRAQAETRLHLSRVRPDGVDGRLVETWPGAHPSLSGGGGQRVLAWHRGDTVRVRVGK